MPRLRQRHDFPGAVVMMVVAVLVDRQRFGMATELGAYLDPLADKVLIVSIYVALGITGALPAWLVILVVSRDIMIVGAVILSWLVDHPVAMKPLAVSKLNTAAQIVFATLKLASLGIGFDAEPRKPVTFGVFLTR